MDFLGFLADEPWGSALLFTARLFLSLVFLVSGIHKGIWYSKAVREFEAAHVPFIPFFLPLTIVLHTILPICMISGYLVRESALILALFTLAATTKVHHFWTMTGAERLEHSRIALDHLAVIGGLVAIAVVGPGGYTLI